MPPVESESLQLLEVLALAVVQGIAEFLPISSSGHVVVGSTLLDKTFDITELNIVLHAGTLLSILVYYRIEVIQLLVRNLELLPKIVLATLPAVVFGLTLKKLFPEILEDALLSGFMFVATGFLLIALAKIDERNQKRLDAEPEGKQPRSVGLDYQDISYRNALLIGCFQAIAVLPGISRSGSTIVAGCLTGLSRRSAATFSFLLAIPVISGATVLESKKMLEQGPSTSPWFLLMGFVIAFVVGIASLILLVRWLGKGKLHWFAYYVIPLGFIVVAWQLWEMTGSNPLPFLQR